MPSGRQTENTSRPTELVCFAFGDSSFTEAPSDTARQKHRRLLLLVLFFLTILFRDLNQVQVVAKSLLCYNFLHENDVIYFRENKDLDSS